VVPQCDGCYLYGGRGLPNRYAVCYQQGVQRLLVEIGCKDLVELWLREDRQRSMVAGILKQMKDLSSCSCFENFSFCLQNGLVSCNRAAHECAKVSLQLSTVWQQPPESVLRAIELDYNSLFSE
jgi:hypothetical protein